MAVIKYVIDAKADSIVILKNPNASFAPWSLADDGLETTVSAPESGFATEPSTFQESAVEESAVEESAVEESAAEYVTGNTDQETFEVVANVSDDSEAKEGKEFWYYVSRRHLTSASPIFERMLAETNWKEGVRNDNDGLYHVPAEDWDSEALLYFMQILHLRNSQVPRTVSLEMLAKIAVLIDFYKCAEALESFTERWVEHLKVAFPVPSHFCRDLMLWTCIAWVLKLPKEFLQITTVLIRGDEQELPTLGLPITNCIDRIEKSRTQAIGTIFSKLQDLLENFRSPQYQCPHGYSFECGSMLYGALVKGMESQNLSPAPKIPYSGLMISEIYTKIRRIRSPKWYHTFRALHRCDLNEMVLAAVDPITHLATGPELKDFECH